jgi:hypothetical protein
MIEESSQLPISQRKAVYKDCLLDILVDSPEWKTIASRQDLVRVITSLVRSNLDIKPALEETEFIRDLSTLADLVYNSESIDKTQRLVEALKSNPDNQEASKAYMAVTGDTLAVRIPAYDTENTGQTDALGKYLRWACALLGLKDPKVKLLPDSTLGNSIQLQARTERMIDNTTAALSLPPSESGDRAEFKTGFKANLVELLATIKLMRKYSGSVQKGIAPKGKMITPITLDDLRKSVNGRAGLNEHGITPFTAIFVKSVFNELTKPQNDKFPGLWIHSLKASNGVKSNLGVVYKLGYECKVASTQKVISVIQGQVREKKPSDPKAAKKASESTKDSDKKFEVITANSKTVPNGISHREFRLGAFLLLPLIDPKDKRSPKDQLSVDILTLKEKSILNFYSKNRDVVDATNLAYATKSALGHKGTKASTLGYRSARGHAIALTANRVWQDATGKEYQKLMDVPEHIRNFLLHLLNRKLVEGEAEPEDESGEEEVSASEEEADKE